MHALAVSGKLICVCWHAHARVTSSLTPDFARTCKLYFWTETFLIVHFYCHMHISNVRLYCISTAAARLNVWFVHYLVYSVFLFLVLCPSPIGVIIYPALCLCTRFHSLLCELSTACILKWCYCMQKVMWSTAANVQTAETWTDTSEWQWCISIQ